MAVTGAALRQFDAIDLNAFHALARGETDLLLRHQCRHARTSERAGMNVDVGPARFRDHEAEAFLLIEELHVPIAHRTAPVAWSSRWPRAARQRLSFRCREIDAVHSRDLHAALTIRDIAVHRCALWELSRSEMGQRRSMTEGVRSIVQGDEAKTFRGVKPFHGGALGSGPRAGTRIVVVRHDEK